MDITVLNEQRCMPVAMEADYLRVRVFPDPEQAALTLATIERIVDNPYSLPRLPRVRKLIEMQPMTREDALAFAHLYAARKRIRLVLTSE